MSNPIAAPAPTLEVIVSRARLSSHAPSQWSRLGPCADPAPLSLHPAWMSVLQTALRHQPFCIEARDEGETVGLLPLCLVQSLLFGRFLVSMPYLNYGGVQARDSRVAAALIDRAVELADELRVDHLELRHATAIDHPRLAPADVDKVNMRMSLPATAGQLWDQIGSKVRNQVKKGRNQGLGVSWGGESLVDAFHEVFSRNMRDLGTPSYGVRLFVETLRQFGDRAELCVVTLGSKPIAGAILLHGWGVTEVPSASSLREFNHKCANMLMYWHLLERSVERGQGEFDFGRCTPGGPTHAFKRQWGAIEQPAQWQRYARKEQGGPPRASDPKYSKAIRIWQRMPLWLSRTLGPHIVRGIP